LLENELIAKDSSLDSEFSHRILNKFRPTIKEAIDMFEKAEEGRKKYLS